MRQTRHMRHMQQMRCNDNNNVQMSMNKTLQIVGTGLLQARCHSSHTTNSLKAERGKDRRDVKLGNINMCGMLDMMTAS